MDEQKPSIIDLQKESVKKKITSTNERYISVLNSFWGNEFVQRTIYDLSAAEFPLFFYSAPPGGGASYTYRDIVKINGERTERSWKVKWISEDGYPSASTQETFFALLQMAREQGFPEWVDFGSVYELRKRMGKKNLNAHYEDTLRDLHCLLGMRVVAINSCWNKEEGGYHPMLDFSLFNELLVKIPKDQDEVSLHRHNKKQNQKIPSVIEVGKTFLASLKSGSTLLLSFDSDFFYSLSPVEQRLAVLLTKYRKFSGKTEYSRNLKKLAEQIPLFVKETYHIKSFLKRSLASLKSKGLSFFMDFSFDMDNDKEEKVVFTFTKDNERAAKELIRNTILGRPKNLPPREEHKILACSPGRPEPERKESPDIKNLSPWLRETLLRYCPPEE